MSEQTAYLANLEQRLARLECIEAIKQLQVDYASACDNSYDPDAIAELFTPDGVWDGGEALGKCVGREAIRERFSRTHERVLWAMHFMIAPKIDVEPDLITARGFWYLLEPATLADTAGPTGYWIATIYDIGYRRDASGNWLIERMAFSGGMRAPYEGGWAATNG